MTILLTDGQIIEAHYTLGSITLINNDEFAEKVRKLHAVSRLNKSFDCSFRIQLVQFCINLVVFQIMHYDTQKLVAVSCRCKITVLTDYTHQ